MCGDIGINIESTQLMGNSVFQRVLLNQTENKRLTEDDYHLTWTVTCDDAGHSWRGVGTVSGEPGTEAGGMGHGRLLGSGGTSEGLVRVHVWAERAFWLFPFHCFSEFPLETSGSLLTYC